MSLGIHRSVMVREVLQALRPERGGLFFDGTVGSGGHTEALLLYDPAIRVIAVDRDEEAIASARGRLRGFGGRFEAVHLDCREAPTVLRTRGINQLDGALLDLGVSSLQLEDPNRGFSFQSEGPLDMRMDRRQPLTARQLVNGLPEEELSDLLYKLGEERDARRIARQIVRARAQRGIETTRQLVEIVAQAVRYRHRSQIHPATKTFQAIRIAVNEELRGLGELLHELVRLLGPGARLAVISFHSLEDRIVKRSFRLAAGECQCPSQRSYPRMEGRCPICGAERLAEMVPRKPIRPSAEEIETNPRVRSAKLRVCERRLARA